MAREDTQKNIHLYKVIEEKNEEIALLKEQIIFLEEKLNLEEEENMVPLCFGLKPQQAILLTKLYKNQGKHVPYDILLRSLYKNNIYEKGTKTSVIVVISYLRKNIKKYGLLIENRRGSYILPGSMGDKLTALIDQHKNCSTDCMCNHE